MKKIFWIASYPKSGNTWMRSILISLFFTENGKFDFNNFNYIQNFEKTKIFDFLKKNNPSEYKKLTNFKILSKYWLKAQEELKINTDFIFLKTHHACIQYYGNFFTTPKYSRGLIYIMRDPRDVAISYAKHTGTNLNRTIKLMSEISEYYYNSKVNEKFIAMLNPWDEHIESWMRLEVPKLIFKYEDILQDPEKIIQKIGVFFQKEYAIEINNFNAKINNIIKTTNFDNLKEIEDQEGFKEAGNSKFFREGKKNQWKEVLTKEQIRKIENSFKKKMEKFGYI